MVPAFRPCTVHMPDEGGRIIIPSHYQPVSGPALEWHADLPERPADFHEPESNRHEVPEWYDDYPKV